MGRPFRVRRLLRLTPLLLAAGCAAGPDMGAGGAGADWLEAGVERLGAGVETLSEGVGELGAGLQGAVLALSRAETPVIGAEATPRERRRQGDPVRYARHVAEISNGVALVIEPAEGVSPRISNMLGSAMAEAFGGERDSSLAIGADRLFTARAIVPARAVEVDRRFVVDWRFVDPAGEIVSATYAQADLPPAPNMEERWRSIGPAEARLVSREAARRFLRDVRLRDALATAQAVAAIARVPEPRRRPERD